MIDTSEVFKVIVLGSLLSVTGGQRFVFPGSFSNNPRRARPVFFQHTPVQRRPVFFGAPRPATHQFQAIGHPGLAHQQFGVAPTRHGAIAFGGTPIHVGAGMQHLVNPNQARVMLTATQAPLTIAPITAQTPQKKIADMLVQAIVRNHEIRMRTSTTTPSPFGVTGNALGVTGNALGITGNALGITGNALGITGNALGITGNPRGTHTHGFLQPRVTNPVSKGSQVIVHRHGVNQQPHVHIASNSGHFPQQTTVPDILNGARGMHDVNIVPHNYPRDTRPIVPNVLSASPGAPNMRTSRTYRNQLQSPHDPFRNLPHFLTGGNKKKTVSKQMNTSIKKPTVVPVPVLRKQIPAPTQPTTPTQPNTNPSVPVRVYHDDNDDQDQEGETFTQLNPPVSQIPAPPRNFPAPTASPQQPMVTSASTTIAMTTPTTLPIKPV